MAIDTTSAGSPFAPSPDAAAQAQTNNAQSMINAARDRIMASQIPFSQQQELLARLKDAETSPDAVMAIINSVESTLVADESAAAQTELTQAMVVQEAYADAQGMIAERNIDKFAAEHGYDAPMLHHLYTVDDPGVKGNASLTNFRGMMTKNDPANPNVHHEELRQAYLAAKTPQEVGATDLTALAQHSTYASAEETKKAAIELHKAYEHCTDPALKKEMFRTAYLMGQGYLSGEEVKKATTLYNNPAEMHKLSEEANKNYKNILQHSIAYTSPQDIKKILELAQAKGIDISHAGDEGGVVNIIAELKQTHYGDTDVKQVTEPLNQAMRFVRSGEIFPQMIADMDRGMSNDQKDKAYYGQPIEKRMALLDGYYKERFGTAMPDGVKSLVRAQVDAYKTPAQVGQAMADRATMLSAGIDPTQATFQMLLNEHIKSLQANPTDAKAAAELQQINSMVANLHHLDVSDPDRYAQTLQAVSITGIAQLGKTSIDFTALRQMTDKAVAQIGAPAAAPTTALDQGIANNTMSVFSDHFTNALRDQLPALRSNSQGLAAAETNGKLDLATLREALKAHGVTSLDTLDASHTGATVDEIKAALKTPITADAQAQDASAPVPDSTPAAAAAQAAATKASAAATFARKA